AEGVLDYWASLLYRHQPALARGEPPPGPQARVPDPASLPAGPVLAEFDPGQAPQLDDALCPYLGLDAFREANQDKFFGREWLVEDMAGRLKENRFLAVVGPSGSGKSSLVLAGLLPALKAGQLLPGSA